MDLILVALCFAFVVWLYFYNNPLKHGRWFMIRRFLNWFPLGMTYAFLYMGRYNLNVSKNAMGAMMSKEDFGLIFAAGTITYAVSFLINGPLVDKIGGKLGIMIAASGAAIANILMGVFTYFYITGKVNMNMVMTFSILYAVNMYFQSYGAVSIIKVKSYWFHVRERGIFGAIFGTLISFGVYFAFDWGQAIVEATKINQTGDLTTLQRMIRFLIGSDHGTVDPTWFVFFIPAVLLVFWVIIDFFLIKDDPREAGFPPFETADASTGEEDKEFSLKDLLKKIFTNPILITIAFIELTSGVLRNGIMQWYFIFAKESGEAGAQFFMHNWGLLLCMGGIVGGFGAGIISDKFFNSRRGPPVAICNVIMLVSVLMMAIFLYSSPVIVGISAIIISMAVIGVHSLLSGTAAADFGGKKATGTASGITDGFVYLGTGIQSISLGYLTSKSWHFWPLFLVPFTILGLYLALKIWKALPEATKKYLKEVENKEV